MIYKAPKSQKESGRVRKVTHRTADVFHFCCQHCIDVAEKGDVGHFWPTR